MLLAFQKDQILHKLFAKARDDVVTVAIGKETKSFTYFSAIFSGRWNQQDSLEEYYIQCNTLQVELG